MLLRYPTPAPLGSLGNGKPRPASPKIQKTHEKAEVIFRAGDNNHSKVELFNTKLAAVVSEGKISTTLPKSMEGGLAAGLYYILC